MILNQIVRKDLQSMARARLHSLPSLVKHYGLNQVSFRGQMIDIQFDEWFCFYSRDVLHVSS